MTLPLLFIKNPDLYEHDHIVKMLHAVYVVFTRLTGLMFGKDFDCSELSRPGRSGNNALMDGRSWRKEDKTFYRKLGVNS